MAELEHNCAVAAEDTWYKNLGWFRKAALISPDNPLRWTYFRSASSIIVERKRHIQTNKYAIHPFSKFKAWYDLFLIYVYFSVVVTKPFEAAFMNVAIAKSRVLYAWYSVWTDALCWVDIVLHFFIGYDGGEKKIELRASRIARHYVLSPFFFCDVISSLPKGLSVHWPETTTRSYVVGVMSIMGLFKLVRLGSLIKCIWRSAEYFRIESRGKLFLMCSVMVSFLVSHWMACMQYYIPKLVKRTFREVKIDDSWFMLMKLNNKSVMVQYVHGFFRSSAYMLGVKLNIYGLYLSEEVALAILTYILGKIIIAFIWIILAVSIFNSRLMEITFIEIVNQLQEYMRQRQLPLNLRNRILQYYTFKYRNKYFKERLINNLLSENLRNEANLHVCKSLIKSVTLFADLNPIQLRKVVDCLILEIFLPNDTIVHANSYGDAMYFLFTGTVAVYSRAGKEICHLQDGAYFGEISLLLKNHHLRVASIVALETSQVYRLRKKDFDRCLITNKVVKTKMLEAAEIRLTEITAMDDEYKKKIFEEAIRSTIIKTV